MSLANCACCGLMYELTDDRCYRCRRADLYAPMPEHALSDGSWVLDPVRRVLVWTGERDTDDRPPKARPDCGTTRGYRHHRNNRETACDACREANSAASRERWERKRRRDRGEAA